MLPMVLVLASRGPRTCWLSAGVFFAGAVSPAGRDGAGSVRAGADFSFVIGDPVADFELHHFALAVCIVEIIDGVQNVGSLLVVLEHEMAAHGGDGDGKADAEAPARDIDFVDGLIAGFAVAGVPDPVPVVVKAIFGEGLVGSGAGPEIVMDAGGNRGGVGVADGAAPLVANRARHIDVADGAVADMVDGFEHAGIGAGLAAVLANAIVFFYGADELAAFEGVMRAGLFDVDVFRGLAAPNGDERVPMIGSGDGDGVDFLVFEELANVEVTLGLGQAHFFDVAEALVEDVFVDITESGEFDTGDVRKAVDVILAAAADSADGDADAIVGAENFAAQRERCRAHGNGFAGRFKKVAPLDFHGCRLCIGNAFTLYSPHSISLGAQCARVSSP